MDHLLIYGLHRWNLYSMWMQLQVLMQLFCYKISWLNKIIKRCSIKVLNKLIKNKKIYKNNSTIS